MRLLFSSFLLIYGLMHAYAFQRARAALQFDLRQGMPLVLFMVVMVLTPFIVRYSEREGLEMFARVMSYGGYLWMGTLLLFVSASLAVDVFRILLYLINSMISVPIVSVSAKAAFFTPLVFSIAAAGYGFFEAGNIRLEHVVIRTSKLPAGMNKLKIAQISDVHLGLIVREERLRRVIEKVKEAGPDLLVSTGDLVDGQINRLEGFADMLKEVEPRYGKFAVTGNHEFFAGVGQALDFTKRAGFRVLRGETYDLEGIMNIAGVDDPAGNMNGRSIKVPEKQLLSGLDHDKFTLLLKHRPDVDNEAVGLFDLQLSGHTHKGQIFPFSLVTKMYYPLDAGMLHLIDHKFLYVSRGSGTWGPPIRFLSPPEVTVIELVRPE